MLEQVRENCGRVPDKTTADAGYWAPEAPQECTRLGTDVFISTARKKHAQSHGALPPPSSNADDARAKMRLKLQTDEGKKIYRRTKAVVEPVFGQVKETRGFRRFLLRGLDAVHGEWSLVCTAHNLLKLFRYMHLDPA